MTEKASKGDTAEKGQWVRIGRLVRLIPRLAEQLGCRRRDHVTRASVDEVPEGTDPEIIERRKRIARGQYNQETKP